MSENWSRSKQYAKYQKQRRRKNEKVLCLAPFTNLNFYSTGDVNVCCYSRPVPIGRYPDMSVQELIQSPKLQDLREKMLGNIAQHNCWHCLEQLSAENFKGMLATTYDGVPKSINPYQLKSPLSLDFEISNVCNLECIMCHGESSSLIRKNREHKPPVHIPYDKEFIRQLRPLWPDVVSAKFLGGEPFLNHLYFDIWKDIAEINPGIVTQITTNGTVMNDKVLRAMDGLRPHISISIDGVTKKTYEKIRKNASFAKVMENTDIFLGLGVLNQKTVSILTCPMTENWQEIPDLLRWASDKMLPIYFNTVFFPEELSLKFGSRQLQTKVVDFYDQELKKLESESRGTSVKAKVRKDSAKRLQNVRDQIFYWSQRAK